jgi:hypothetical protein
LSLTSVLHYLLQPEVGFDSWTTGCMMLILDYEGRWSEIGVEYTIVHKLQANSTTTPSLERVSILGTHCFHSEIWSHSPQLKLTTGASIGERRHALAYRGIRSQHSTFNIQHIQIILIQRQLVITHHDIIHNRPQRSCHIPKVNGTAC